MTDITEALAIPDPDPETLPDIIPSEAVVGVDVAARILRAALRAEGNAARITERMQSEMAAWQAMISRETTRAQTWRSGVAYWMTANAVEKIQTPWFTASFTKGRTRIIVDDEAQAIAVTKTLGAKAAIKIVEKLVKAEFDDVYNARPAMFVNIAHEETGEPSLVIRKKEAK